MHIFFPSLSARQWSMVTGWDAHAQSTAESPQGNSVCSPNTQHTLLASQMHTHISHHIHFDRLNYVCGSAACTSTFLYLSTCVCVGVSVCGGVCVCLPACVPPWLMSACLTFSAAEFVRVSLLLTSPVITTYSIGHCKQTLKPRRGKGSM